MTLSNIFNSIISFIGDGITGIKWWISFIWHEVNILYIIGFIIFITVLGGIQTINFKNDKGGRYDPKTGKKTHDENGNKIK
tara:strand:- start:66 stop:308 length:243 start_codon:yes stop_codon:yes gene_type:complete